MPTYADRLRYWRKSFLDQGFATAALDARLLLQHVSGFDSASLITKDRIGMPAEQSDQFDELCARRIKGEPIARILGHKEFFGRAFKLNDDTLIPRPETELLVEKAIEFLPKGGRFLDLGTGTGAIAISILLERMDVFGVATDLSENALECAKENANALGASTRLETLHSDWFADVAKTEFDLILSNPPYISHTELGEMNDEARLFDPELALFADDDGLAAYKLIAADACSYLKPSGQLMVEIGHRQASAISEIFSAAGFVKVSVLQDLSGLNRVVVGQRL